MAKPRKPDYMRTFDTFWRPLVSTNGMVDMDKVARELADYHDMLDEVPKVYDHVTRGRFSKPNTLARHVIAAHDDVCTEDTNEAVKEAREEWEADRQPAKPDAADDAILRLSIQTARETFGMAPKQGAK